LLEHGPNPGPAEYGFLGRPSSRPILGTTAATDFFTVEVLTLTDLVRYWVLFITDIKTRRVQLADSFQATEDCAQ